MLIQCNNLQKQYKSDNKIIKAVNDVNLSINRRDFVVILGHSGSGKTTLLSLIGGLTRPDQGEVRINGQENWQQNDNALAAMRNNTIGFIFQFASLIPTLSVLENVLLPLSFGTSRAESHERALNLLSLAGIADKAGSFPSQLSGGQQRRVAIARAFINEPEIILADEPTGDLDEDTEQDILTIFRDYNQQGTTFIVVTHNQELPSSQNAARVMQMRNGILSETR